MPLDYKAIQAELIRRGFSCGRAGADGIPGRDTIAAIARFQAQFVPGIQWPGTVGSKTLAALRLTEGVPGVAPLDPPWLAELRRRMGLTERVPSSLEKLKLWLKSDGRTLGDPSKQPWCGDAMETCIALTLPHERMIANPYLARNWLGFGKRLLKPIYGSIGVFWRGSPSSLSGHVGIIVGEDATHYSVAGGNQSDSISIVRIEKRRFLGSVWPLTHPIPTNTALVAGGGVISTNEA